MRASSFGVLVRPTLLLPLTIGVTGCSERYCSEVDVCWATRDEIIAAAERCGTADFEPNKAGPVYSAIGQPYDSELSNCIADDLRGQGLMVTH